jgi:hypothetical protein
LSTSFQISGSMQLLKGYLRLNNLLFNKTKNMTVPRAFGFSPNHKCFLCDMRENIYCAPCKQLLKQQKNRNFPIVLCLRRRISLLYVNTVIITYQDTEHYEMDENNYCFYHSCLTRRQSFIFCHYLYRFRTITASRKHFRSVCFRYKLPYLYLTAVAIGITDTERDAPTEVRSVYTDHQHHRIE